MKRAVVCISGGMDSLAALATVIDDREVTLLHLNYGQRTEVKEFKTFHAIGRWYNIPEERKLVIETNLFKLIGTSCLTDSSIKVPEKDPAMGGVPVSYVPFRNGVILSMAVAAAEAIGAEEIITGFVEVDSSGYPDCTEMFVQAMEQAGLAGTKPKTHIKIITPVIFMTKSDIVGLAVVLGAPLHLSWSCYKSSVEACGTCASCVLRIGGFMQARYIDPIPYAVNINWKQARPYKPRELKSQNES